MDETSLSLIDRLQSSENSTSWLQLNEIYGPLLNKWLRRYHLQSADAEDVVQEVLMAVAKELPSFEHNGRPGAFRSWLRSVMVHRLLGYWRIRNRLPKSGADSRLQLEIEQLQDPNSELSQVWNREHDEAIVRKLLQACEEHFSQQTWQAFKRVALEGVEPKQVASELGMSLNAVFIAKSRVLTRMRSEAKGLVEASDFSSKA